MCAALAATGAWAGEAERLLALAKEATGGGAWDRVRSLRYRTRFEERGASRVRESLVDLASGRFLTIERKPAGDSKDGFDGRLAWRQGRGLLVLSPDQRLAMTVAYMKSHGYYFPERWQADLRFLGTRTVEGRPVDSIELRPAGGGPVELDLDAGTHRPAAERYGEDIILYEDYRETGGLGLARRSRPSGGVAAFTAETEDVVVDPPVDDGDFAAPVPRVEFTEGVPWAAVPSRRGSIIEARFGEAGPFPFIVDTGGFAQLSPALVRRLVDGVAPNTAVALDATFGGVTFSSLAFLNSLGLGNVAAKVFDGREEAGVLGVETFLSAIVRFEPAGPEGPGESFRAAGSVVFLSTAGFSPPEGADTLPLEFEAGKPVVTAVLEGEAARFVLDTGSNAEVVLFPSFLDKTGLRGRLPAGSPAAVVHGFLTLAGTRSRAKGLVLGPFELPEVVAHLVDGNIPGAPDVAGLIGMGVLGRRAVTFDYRNRKVYIGR